MFSNIRLRAVACIMAATLCLTSCGAPTNGEGLVDQDTVDQEYKSTISSLSFPALYPPPSELPRPAEKSLYGQGYGTGMAERMWICSWEREWLDASSGRDESRETVALKNLEAAPETLFMSKQLDDAGRRLYADYLTKARLGDPSGIQQDVEQNCGG